MWLCMQPTETYGKGWLPARLGYHPLTEICTSVYRDDDDCPMSIKSRVDVGCRVKFFVKRKMKWLCGGCGVGG